MAETAGQITMLTLAPHILDTARKIDDCAVEIIEDGKADIVFTSCLSTAALITLSSPLFGVNAILMGLGAGIGTLAFGARVVIHHITSS